MPRHFPNWLKAYTSFAADTEAPLLFHVWAALSTVASALRRRVWIDEFKWQWFPNLYVVFVGPAGFATKTTALSGGVKLLKHVEGVYFGPKSFTWQSFIQHALGAQQELVLEGPEGETSLTICPVTIATGELGTFFKTDDDTMMDVLTDLWDNPEGEWIHRTLHMGDNKVINPCINIIGGTTETWIRRHFHEDMIGGGLASRIIFVYGDQKTKLVPYLSRIIDPKLYYMTEQHLIEDLQHIAELKGRYVLSEGAYAWGSSWYVKMHTGQRPAYLASDRYSAYLSRKQTFVHKLAMIVAASQRDELIIRQEDLEEGLRLLELVEPHMQKVFESIGQVQEARRTHELANYIRHYGVITAEHLWALVTNIMTKKEFDASLTSGVQSGHFTIVSKDGHRAVRLSDKFLESLRHKAKKPD